MWTSSESAILSKTDRMSISRGVPSKLANNFRAIAKLKTSRLEFPAEPSYRELGALSLETCKVLNGLLRSLRKR